MLSVLPHEELSMFLVLLAVFIVSTKWLLRSIKLAKTVGKYGTTRREEKKYSKLWSSDNNGDIPRLPVGVFVEHILPFLSDRTTWNSLSICNKEVYETSKKGPSPPWPKEIDLRACVGASVDSRAFRISTTVFSPRGEAMAIGGLDGSIWVFGKKRGLIVRLQQQQQSKGSVIQLAFSHDEQFLVSSHEMEGDIKDVVLLWRIADDKNSFCKKLETPGSRLRLRSNFTFHPDGSFFVTGLCQSVEGWNVPDGSWKESIHDNLTLDTNDTNITFFNSVDFSPDGKSLITAGANITNITLAGLRELMSDPNRVVPIRELVVQHFTLWDVVVGMDGEKNSVRVRKHFENYSGAILCIAYAPNGKYFATASVYGMIKLWATTGDQRLITTLEVPNEIIKSYGYVGKSISFSEDSKKLMFLCSTQVSRHAARSKKVYHVRLWDLEWKKDDEEGCLLLDGARVDDKQYTFQSEAEGQISCSTSTKASNFYLASHLEHAPHIIKMFSVG